MQVICLIWGILALVGMLVAFVPCLGALNWLNIPFSVAGLIVSIIALVTTKEPSRGAAVAAVVLCGVAALLGLIRLAVGGGVF